MEWYFALRPRLLVTIPFLLIIGVGFIYHFPLGFFYLVDAGARKSGIVKPIRIVDKGDRRQAPEMGQIVVVRPQAEVREVGAYELDQ